MDDSDLHADDGRSPRETFIADASTSRASVMPRRTRHLRRLFGPSAILLAILSIGLALRSSWPMAEHGPFGGDRPVYGTMPGDVPFGFHPDEGHNALDAWRIASEGWRPIFLERNNGREPLFMYLMAAAMSLFGPTIQAARSAGALAGMAAIGAQFLLVRALPFRRPTRVALLSAAGLAFTFWPVAQARYALRANLLPVWVALMLWAWWHAVRGFCDAAAPRDRSDLEPAAGDVSARESGDLAGPTGRDSLRPDATNASSDGLPGRTSGALDVLNGSALLWAALAGMFIGLAVHTHLIGRGLPVVLAVSSLWVVFRERRPWVLAPLGCALFVALLTSWPQIAYFRASPEMITYRAEQVSVLNPEVNEGDLVGTLIRNGWSLIKTPIVEGDRSWHHNIERRPVFVDLGSRVALVIGLVVFSAGLIGRSGRLVQCAAVLLAAALILALLPSWWSVGAPNYARLTAVWPVLFLLPALGVDRAAEWIGARAARTGRGAIRSRISATAVLVLVPIGLLLTTAHDYFREYAGRREVYDAFNAAAVERGQTVVGLPPAPLYLSPGLWDQAVIRFLCIERPPHGVFNAQDGMVFPPAPSAEELRGMPSGSGSSHGAHYAFDRAESEAADAFGSRWPMAARTDFPRRVGGSPAESPNLVVFTLSDTQIEAVLSEVSAPNSPPVFGEKLRLDRLSAEPEPLLPGGSIELVLVWRAFLPTEVDHNFFLRLISSVDGGVIATFDGPPLGGTYPTDRWAPGERILMPMRLDLADDARPGPATLRHGWYDWRDGRPLPIAGDRDADGAAEIATFEIATR